MSSNLSYFLLEDPESYTEYKTRFVSELMEKLLEDLGPANVQPLNQIKPSIDEAIQDLMNLQDTEVNTAEEPLGK